MTRVQTSLLALSLSALPLAAGAQVTSEQILSCTADRSADGCSEVLTRAFVCERAEAMVGCADVLQARADALAALESANEADIGEEAVDAEDVEEAEDAAAEAEVEEGTESEEGEEFVSDTEEEFDGLEVRAEGEASEEAGPGLAPEEGEDETPGDVIVEED